MLESPCFAIALGCLLGFLSGLGIGGGSLLILWLTIILGVPQNTARIINLLFFIPSALIACCFRWKQSNLNWKAELPAIVSGCIAAGMFSILGAKMDTTLLKKLFGGLLLLTGLREISYKPKKTQRSK